MRKGFKFYLPCWGIAFVLFSLIAFLVPETVNENKFSTSFWIGYAFIAVMFLIQLACSISFFSQDVAKDGKMHSKNKTFLNIPVISISYTALIVSIIIGVVAMVVPSIPIWIGIAVDVCVAIFYVLSIVLAKATADTIDNIDQKVKAKTYFIKSLTVSAESIVARAKSEEVKAVAKKVYEAIRYSDPMSNEALASVESQIATKFNEYSNAVLADNAELSSALGKELLMLIEDRNSICKMLK